MENEPHFEPDQNDYYYAYLWNTRIMHNFSPNAFESALCTIWSVEKTTNKCNKLIITLYLESSIRIPCVSCAFFLADFSQMKPTYTGKQKHYMHVTLNFPTAYLRINRVQ